MTKDLLYISLLLITISSCKQQPSNNTSLVEVQNEKYNILFMVVDDLRPLLGSYGLDYIYSPNIDTLAIKGLKFEKAFAQAPICSPSRMSFLTGLRPHESGLTNNKANVRDKLPDIQTLPQLFKEQGYQTRAHGKVFHQGNGDSLSWDYYDDSPRQRSAYHLKKNTTINDPYDGSKRGRPYEAADIPDSLYTDGIIVNRAIKELDSFAKDKPFFLAVGLLKPHLPFNSPKKYWDIYEDSFSQYQPIDGKPKDAPDFAFQNSVELRKYHSVPKTGALPKSLQDSLTQGYLACVSYADAQIGKLLDKIEEKELTENTIIVLLGDHGYHLGDFDDWCKNTQYELDTRVPLIIYHPDKSSGVVKQMVELIDLYPTLVDLANLQSPKHKLSGQSLKPLFDNVDMSLKNFALSENKRKKYLGFGLTNGNYRLIEWRNRKNPQHIEKQEFYDYSLSPYEHQNLAGNKFYDSIIKEMQSKIKTLTPTL